MIGKARIAALITLALFGGQAEARPTRVMSINQCTDQIVLMLLPPERIASVSWLSRDPSGSLMAAAARRVAVNRGTAEEVVRQRPDLVIAGSFTTPATRALLRRLRYPLVEVPEASSIDDIRTVTMTIARAVGQERRGRALLARMDRDLALLARNVGPAVRVAAWDGDGFGASPGSLYGWMLRSAGAVNVADLPPVSGHAAPDVELLLAARPALLVRASGGPDEPGLRANVAHHPIVHRYWDEGRTIRLPSAAYACGTPLIADAALKLRARLRAAAGAAQKPIGFAR